ncbi:unnamed protein product [Ixodes hexagonus]
MHLFYLCVILSCSALVRCTSDSATRELPDCSKAPKSDDAAQPKTFRELFIVGTLDGRISALDPREHGNVVWSHETGPGPLLSSSLSRLEMRNRGQRVRLIPSLDGSLYKFNGETVEPLPLTADFLLKSSFKLGDDLVITGGKEARSYGINLHSGQAPCFTLRHCLQLRYVCTMSGCNQTKDDDYGTEDVLVVKRDTQTVRAVEPRSGQERWNFSVGENHLSMLKGLMPSCTGSSGTASDAASYSSEESGNCSSEGVCDEQAFIRVGVPEGVVRSAKTTGGFMEWTVELHSPVVSAWHLRNGELEPVNLFEQGRILGISDPNQSSQENPLLYLGMHKNQLYVQQSGSLQTRMNGRGSHLALTNGGPFPRIEWKPYLASAPSRTPMIHVGRTEPPHALMETTSPGKALMLKEDVVEYPFDMGYYLYKGPELDNISDGSLLCEEEEPTETLDQYIIVSFWYWWKEVLGISIATSLLVNILITRHVLRRWKHSMQQESSSSKEAKQPPETPPKSIAPVEPLAEQTGVAILDSLPKYTSRYLADFDPVRCLGKGGFGLVLESRNKLDDCTYAVKRICLPNNPEARDKVMREAKALAKLDHAGIVRYYNAWLESPPPGWQEHQDDVWHGSFDLCTSSVYSESEKTATSAAQQALSPNATRPFNPLRPFDEPPSFDVVFSDNFVSHDSSSSGITADRLLSSFTTNGLPFGTYAVTDGEDSFIKFEHSESAKDESEKKKKKPVVPKERPSSLCLDENHCVKVYLYIQMQLCKKESLKEWLNAHAVNRDYEQVLDIFYQIVSAVEYIHENGLIHRDLKPSNIFFAMDDAVKVGDFGLVTALTGGSVVATPSEPTTVSLTSESGRLTDQVGTQLYMSPEQIDGLKYNQSVDIFSLGLIFFELLWPFSTQMERIQDLMNAKRLKFPDKFRKTYPSECKLIEQLLSHSSDKRPSARDIRQDRLFQPFQPCEEVVNLARLRRRNLSHRNSSSLSD